MIPDHVMLTWTVKTSVKSCVTGRDVTQVGRDRIKFDVNNITPEFMGSDKVELGNNLQGVDNLNDMYVQFCVIV